MDSFSQTAIGCYAIMTLKGIGICAIILSTIIALILSMTADMHGAELGALFNLILPPFVGLIAIIIYLLINWLAKDRNIKIVMLVICCGYLIYIGLVFQFRKGYLPFPFN